MGRTGVDMNMFISTVNMARNDIIERQRTGVLDTNGSGSH